MVKFIYDEPFIDVANNRAGILIQHKNLGLIALCFKPAISKTNVLTEREYSDVQNMVIVNPMTNCEISDIDLIEEIARDSELIVQMQFKFKALGL